LEPCLASLDEQSYRRFETIVVDNGSSDDSASYVRETYPDTRVVELGSNRGFAAAANAGIHAGSGSYVALLNNDVIVEPDWLGELVRCAERHPDAAGIASKLLVHDSPSVIDRAGDVMSVAFRAYPRAHGESDTGQVDEETEVFAASGAASLWRTEALREIDFLDEEIFFGYEDVDLSFRARLAGYSCWYAPKARGWHIGGATAAALSDFVEFEATRNRWRMIIKDVPRTLLVRNLHHILFAEALTIAKHARSRKLRVLGRAYGEIASELHDWRRDRQEVQSNVRVGVDAIRRSLTPAHRILRRRLSWSLKS
jgi:GT2 family glycosyltransferase